MPGQVLVVKAFAYLHQLLNRPLVRAEEQRNVFNSLLFFLQSFLQYIKIFLDLARFFDDELVLQLIPTTTKFYGHMAAYVTSPSPMTWTLQRWFTGFTFYRVTASSVIISVYHCNIHLQGEKKTFGWWINEVGNESMMKMACPGHARSSILTPEAMCNLKVWVNVVRGKKNSKQRGKGCIPILVRCFFEIYKLMSISFKSPFKRHKNTYSALFCFKGPSGDLAEVKGRMLWREVDH